MTKASIEFLPGGLVAPLTVMEPARHDRSGRFDGGVYHSTGEVCELGRPIKPLHSHEPAPVDPSSLSYSDGHCVFGGMLQNEHFGHFIAENLARLWAFDHLDSSYKSVVFYLRLPKQPVAKFVFDTLSLFIPNIDLHIVRAPTQFELVAVPQELMERGYIIGHPLIVAMCRRLSREKMDGENKIYVSRSRLSRGEGGILADRRIDEYMEAEGYKILYPETMSVQDQLAAYSAAEWLVFAEGSALHLYALVAKPTQHVFVIWRRGKYAVFDWQIKTFGGQPLHGESCIEKLWVPENEAPDAAHGKAVLSFTVLSIQLREAGFIAHAPWNEPSASEIEDEIAMISAMKNRKFILKPVPALKR